MYTPFFGAMNESRPRKLSRRFIWTVAVITACLCPTLAFGQTNSSWNGGTGNWSNSTDWTPNQVPNNGGGNTYNVTIDSGGDTVTLNQNATIGSLVLGGSTGSSTLESQSGNAETLNITGGLVVNQSGKLYAENGSDYAAASGTNTGLIELNLASTLTISGNLTNAGSVITTNTSNGGEPQNT